MSNQNPAEFGGEAGGVKQHPGFNVSFLFGVLNDATISAQTKLSSIKNRKSSISLGDMFEMQMLMNHLSQLSEMSTAVISAANQAIQGMARNVK